MQFMGVTIETASIVSNDFAMYVIMESSAIVATATCQCWNCFCSEESNWYDAVFTLGMLFLVRISIDRDQKFTSDSKIKTEQIT